MRENSVRGETPNKVTRVAFVLDKSGSMMNVVPETISGFNEQLDVLRDSANGGHKVLVSLIQFDHNVRMVYNNKNVYDVRRLDDTLYQPSGMTAMYDAVGQAINFLENDQTFLENDQTEQFVDEAFLVIVLSDGYENASKEYTQPAIAAKIKQLQETDKWTFTYLLANQDITQVSQQLNVPLGNMSSYSSDSAGTTMAFNQMSNSTRSYMNSRESGRTSVQNFYEEEEVTS